MRVVLAGDAMLGRGVAERLATVGPDRLFASELRAVFADADAAVLNLECCVSDRGSRWPDPGKRFFFRAPPAAVRALAGLGVTCVSLANNHALDYGVDALADTVALLAAAGIQTVGAGDDVDTARAPAVVPAGDERLAIVALTDHPPAYAAGPRRPGVAYADLRSGGVPAWLADRVRSLRTRADAVLVTPHWGPNMTTEPPAYVRTAARRLVGTGASLVAGHSAHVFHGVSGSVLFDLGDLIDDYSVDPVCRNDLGVVAVVTLTRSGVSRIEVVPIALDFAFTRLASREEYRWIRGRFRRACAHMGTEVADDGDRLVIRN